jgi:diguanylate cyclase (GGDEF)-like protein
MFNVGRSAEKRAAKGTITVAEEKTMAANPMPSPAAKPRHTPLRLLYVGTALLILVLLGTNTAVIVDLRESALLNEEGQLKTLSLIVAEQADRSFGAVDRVLSSVAERVAADGVTDIASFDEKMAGHDIYILLREKITGVPQLDAVILVSHEGKVINFSRSWPIPQVDISDRLFFRAMKQDPNLKSEISEPVQNRTTGTWTMYLAHRVSGPNGEFLGLILGAIELRYFEDFYRAMSLGEGSSVAILRLDGVTLTRFPRTDTVGKVFSNAQRLLGGNVSAVLRQVSPVSGLMGIVAVHRLTNYPVLALATEAEEAALADWRRIAWLMSLGALGCTIAIAIAGFAFGRQSKQQATLAASQAELRRQEDRAAAAHTTALQVAHSAEHDFLTGLPNRMLLNDRVSQAISLAHRHKKHTAVLFLDLDGFKHINDSLGHGVGDKLLQSIAKRLVACVRSSDTVSRQGGDEFVVLLSEVEQSEDAAIAARRIVQAVAGTHSVDEHDVQVEVASTAGRMLKAVAEPHSVEHHNLHVTASIGVSVYPDDGLEAETLIKNADTAMYQAKENGRQSFQFFKPAMNIRAVERQSIEESLRGALERQELALHYQPKINLRTGAITGVEALIRWTHPTRGLIPPLQFIPVAEDCGLIVPIGAWVLREACGQAQAWADAGLPAMTMAVNVSAMEFRDDNFLENLFVTLGETGLDSRLLELELTESLLMRHPESAAAILQSLREVGIQVAMDDFGTGYSSLGYLRKFPLDALKIDQSFVRQISTAGEDTVIVTAVIGIAQGLKLRVIAEGVETREEVEFLRAHQCDEAQGYYFSRPVPPEQLAKLLRTGIPEPRRVRTPRASVDPV